ncbi:MAG: bifunctional UDP-sugar hydrolase/5'-nucleotidase [SAR324 cluster bacterium]|nr:bifunctional UDP-sugar hydrolase/5'-nucleotidase [SAR324 cluster bacterium]
MKKTLSMLLLACFVFYGSLLYAYKKDHVYKLTLLHTNDHHGRFWKNRNGEYGMAARKTMIDRIRQEVRSFGGYVLLLSGGDINTGVPESDLQSAEPDFKGMNMLRYDAMAIGNHEFDNPLEVIRQQEIWAGFPFLAANIFKEGTNNLLFRSHVTYSYDELKVTILGFTTEDTRIIGNPEYLGGIEFRSPVKVGKTLIPKLRKKTDILIAATHMGHYKDANYGSNAPGDITLARSVKGLDIIVGGHSQNPIFEPDVQNGTMILQAHEWGKYVGRMDLEFVNGKLTMKRYKLIPINLKKKVKDKDGKSIRVHQEIEIPEDQEMITFLSPYQEKGKAELETVIGRTNGVFVGERNQVRNNETNLGNLIAITQMAKVGADLAVMNSGGIRADLPAGDITYKDVLIVQPFANTICTVDLSGDELKEYLQIAVSKKKGSGAFAQFVGVELKLEGDRLVEVKVGGKAISSDKKYKLAVNSFAASGGDGYMKVKDHPSYVNTGYNDADALREYIVKNSPLKIEDYAPTGDVTRM